MTQKYVDKGSQYLEKWHWTVINPFIIYGLKHKRTAKEVADLINFAQKQGYIDLGRMVFADTLIHRVRKYDLEFEKVPLTDQERMAHQKLNVKRKNESKRNYRSFGVEEMKLIDSAIFSASNNHKTADYVADLLNKGGLLSREVTPRYLQNRSYHLSCKALKRVPEWK